MTWTIRPTIARGHEHKGSSLVPYLKAVILLLALGIAWFGILPPLAIAKDSSPALASAPDSTALRPDAAALAGEYVKSVSEQLRLQAETQSRQAIAERIDTAIKVGAPVVNLLKAVQTSDEDLKKAMAALLQKNDEPLVQALNQVSRELKQQETELLNQWQNVRTSLYANRLQLFEVKASQQLAGQLAFLLSVDNRWFWLFGLIAVASLVAVAAHDRRHEIRRRLNGGKARAMGLSRFLAAVLVCLAVVTATTFVFGDRVFNWLLVASMGEDAQPREEIDEQNRVAARNLNEANQKAAVADNNYAKAKAQMKAELQGSNPALLKQWEDALSQSQAVHVDLQMQAELSNRLKADIADLKGLQQNVANTAEQTARYHRLRQFIRGALGVGLLGLAAGGGVLFQRGVRRRNQKISNTCPLCLGEGTFEPLDDDAAGDYAGLNMVQCKNVISEQPYEECDFVFTAMYREVPKLCFPTLGIPQAGKTHWLAMVYRELNRGNYPPFVQFERIKSASSNDFDVVVDEILNRKIGPAATQTGRIPYPLVFNFIDRDRLGVSDILVNIFDYSGEVIRSQTLQDRQRQRALDGDGFFFFLDPTEPSETQSEALAGFREDLRRIKGIKAGGQIRTPVALCVSKIDLMLNEPYADPDGGGVIGNFYRDLGEIGWNVDLTSIAARSELVARLRDTIWPGWQIERQIHELFGGRFMFFPLTPVGLDGLGETDLARRIIAPVGLLDPLLWLLHTNGYPVIS